MESVKAKFMKQSRAVVRGKGGNREIFTKGYKVLIKQDE